MVKITVDRHEKNSLVVAELIDNRAEIELKVLPIADYIVGDVAIERKSISDFISSMLNKRLVRQIEGLKQYPNRMLIIEGIEERQLYTENSSTGLHANAVRGMLLSIMLDSKTPVLFTHDYKDTARFLMVLAKRLENKYKDVSFRVKRKSFNVAEQQRMILEGFLGIGPKSAKKLLKHFGTVRAVISASEEELKKIIGKKGEAVFKIINLHY
jgi:Fanconi anemia group M protein